jgi:hypothetical protein
MGFYHEGMLNFVKGFFCTYWDDHVIFVLYYIYVLYLLICVCLPSLYPWNETNLVMVYDTFKVLWSLVCKYFIKNFCIYAYHRCNILQFSLFLCSYLVYLSGWYWLHKMNLAVILCSLFYGIVWEVLILFIFWKSGMIHQ